MKKKLSAFLALLVSILALISSVGCSGDKTDVIPKAEDVASVKVAMSTDCMYADDYRWVKNADIILSDSQTESKPILFEISDTDAIREAVEMNKRLESLESLQCKCIPFRYKCEYTMKDGSRIYNDITRIAENHEELFGNFLKKINKYAVAVLTYTRFDSDEWAE